MSMQVNRPDPDSLNKPVNDPSQAAPNAELVTDALELLDSLDAVKDQQIAPLQQQKKFEADLESLDTALEEIAKGAFEQPATSESEDEPVKMDTRARLPKMEVLDSPAGQDVSKVASRAMGVTGSASQIASDLGEESKVEPVMVRLPGQEDGQGRLVNKDERFVPQLSVIQERIQSLDSNTGDKAILSDLKSLSPAQRQEIREYGVSILAKMANKEKIEKGLKSFEVSDAKKLKLQIRVAEVTSRASEGTAFKEVGETTRKWGTGTKMLIVLGTALEAIGEVGSKIKSGLKNLLSLITFKSTAQAASHVVDQPVVYAEFAEDDTVTSNGELPGKSDATTTTESLVGSFVELDPAAEQKLVTDVLAEIFEKASKENYQYPTYMTSVDIQEERTLNPEFGMALDALLNSPRLESLSKLFAIIAKVAVGFQTTPQENEDEPINTKQSQFEKMQELAISEMKDQPELVKQLKSCKSDEGLLKVIEDHFKPALAALEKKIRE